MYVQREDVGSGWFGRNGIGKREEEEEEEKIVEHAVYVWCGMIGYTLCGAVVGANQLA